MIVVTGASGNIGSKIAADLLAKKQEVRCIARTTQKLSGLADKGAEILTLSLEDSDTLTESFLTADAVFVMIPPNYAAPDFRVYQNLIGASIADAIKKSGVKYVVNLSSQGAQLPEGTGPIKGLHDQEERLNKLKDVNILHLRPTYFMENLLSNIELIKKSNMMGSAIRGDLKFPMIATKDIAQYASERLLKKDFHGIAIRDLLGQRDLSLIEAAEIVSRKCNRPGLQYVQSSYEDMGMALTSMGISEDVSRLFVEMNAAINEGLLNTQRKPENTTATSFEEFAEIFVRLLS